MNSNSKKQARALVLLLLVGIYSLLGSACTRDDGRKAVESAIFNTSQVEQVITGQFCDADNVLSTCP